MGLLFKPSFFFSHQLKIAPSGAPKILNLDWLEVLSVSHTHQVSKVLAFGVGWVGGVGAGRERGPARG